MPQPLTPATFNRSNIVEIIMRAPLDEAVAVAVGRASTCWEYPDGMGGLAGVFDDHTAGDIVNALLARISAELAGEGARVRGADEAATLIPTLAMPTTVVERGQCPQRLRLEGTPQPSRCLLLEGGHDVHQNGNLRWRRDDATGEITGWMEREAYQVIGLGELLRAQPPIHLTLPHLPAEAASVPLPLPALEAEPDETLRATYKSTAEIEPPPQRPPHSPEAQ